MKTSNITKIAGAAAVALACAVSAPASAATIDFATGGNGTASGGAVGALTYTTSCAAGGFLNTGCTVTQSANGLGVNGSPDLQPLEIDGIPGWEVVTVTFSWAVKLVDISLGLIDSNDDMEWSVNGGSWTHVGATIPTPVVIGANNVTSFSVRASNVNTFFGLVPELNDNFTLASATISPVPVPAAGLMLVGALGGLAALRRKRKAA